jgi:tetratricopeptide (TPR) repeat protein
MDWGVLGAVVVAFLLLWALWEVSPRIKESSMAAGAVGGLAALLLLCSVDFGVELSGLGLCALTLFAVLNSTPVVRISQPKRRAVLSLRAGLLLAAAAIVAVAATRLGRPAYLDRLELSAATRHNELSKKERLASAQEMMRRHPADYFPAALAAYALYLRGDSTAILYANRALARKPTSDFAHLVAARMLYAAGERHQACVEYALATQYTLFPSQLVAEVVSRFPTAVELSDCLPTDPDMNPQVIGALQSMRQEEAALLLARKTVARHPGSGKNLTLLGKLELAAGNLRAAENAIDGSEKEKPTVAGAIALAHVYAMTGREEKAEEILLRAETRADNRQETVTALIELARTRLARGRPDDARQTLQRALGQAGGDQYLRAAVHGELARLERLLGNPHRAEWEGERARSLSP